MRFILGLTALTLLASCATQPYRPYAREVKKKPTVEGVIALKAEHVPEDRTYADTLMTKNCGNSTVNVIEEGEVEVGKTTTSNSQTRDEKEDNGFNMAGMKFLTGGQTDVKNNAKTTSVVSLKEWHINYNCKTQVAETTAPTKTKKR